MAEWLIEDGIGETRAALVEDGAIVKARIELPGLRVGTIARGRLRAERRVELDSGDAVLLDRLPKGLPEGTALGVRVTREAIPEPGRAKLAKAVPSEAEPIWGPSLVDRISASGVPIRICRFVGPDLLEEAGWSEVLEEARTGEIAFPGGVLRMSVTPAMTLFDVDGSLAPGKLALAAADAVARAIVRHGIGGSIGIDFPTLGGKAERQAVADAVDAALPQPFERTALNGFGFLQIIRPRLRASLPELLAADPVGAEARALLRIMSRLSPPYPASHMISERAHRRIQAEPEWLRELGRHLGGRIAFTPLKE